MASEDIPGMVHLLAIDAIKIALAVEIADAHGISCREVMARPQHDEELLAKQRKIMQPLVDLVRPAIDRRVQSAFKQAFLQVGCAGVEDLELDPRGTEFADC